MLENKKRKFSQEISISLKLKPVKKTQNETTPFKFQGIQVKANLIFYFTFAEDIYHTDKICKGS